MNLKSSVYKFGTYLLKEFWQAMHKYNESWADIFIIDVEDGDEYIGPVLFLPEHREAAI